MSSHSRFRLQTDTLVAVMLLVVYGLLLLSLKNPTSLDDGLRHFTMAAVMKARGIAQVPGWSTFFYQGYLHTTPVDPWYLSDVLLIPFTYFSIAKGLQLFIIAELTCLLLSFWLVLRSFKLSAFSRTIFILLLMFGDIQFTGRFLLGRPYALMTAMMLFVLWAILERKQILLAVFLGISVLLSQLFVFPLFLCACAWVSLMVAREYKETVRLSVATIGGLLVGFILHPYPMQYIEYLMTAFLRIPFLKSIGLAREMHGGINDLALLSVLAALAVIILFLVRLYARKHLKILNTTILFFTIATGSLTLAFFQWVRAIDVLWPLLLCFAAYVLSLDATAARDLLRLLLPKEHRLKKFLMLFCIVVCAGEVLALPYVFIRDDASHNLSAYDALQVVPPHSRVLNLDWDRFFAYVAVRPDLRYAAGIDRTFTYLTDPAVSERIRTLEETSSADIPDLQSARISLDVILHAYPSDFLVLSAKKFAGLIAALKTDSAFSVVGESKEIAVFAIPKNLR